MSKCVTKDPPPLLNYGFPSLYLLWHRMHHILSDSLSSCLCPPVALYRLYVCVQLSDVYKPLCLHLHPNGQERGRLTFTRNSVPAGFPGARRPSPGGPHPFPITDRATTSPPKHRPESAPLQPHRPLFSLIPP